MRDDLDYDVLGNISDKLTHISEILEKLLAEQQKANLAFENVDEEISFKEEFVCCHLNEFDRTFLNGNTILFLGFGKKDVKELVNKFASSLGANVTYLSSVTAPGEFAAAVNSCQENDFLLLNCSGIIKSQELLNVITDVIADGQINLTIVKGPGARNVLLDVPQIHYVFFESTCFYVPKMLRDEMDLCIWNESDRKRV